MKLNDFRKLVNGLFSSLRFKSKRWQGGDVEECLKQEISVTESAIIQPLMLLPKISFSSHSNDDYYENISNPFPRK